MPDPLPSRLLAHAHRTGAALLAIGLFAAGCSTEAASTEAGAAAPTATSPPSSASPSTTPEPSPSPTPSPAGAATMTDAELAELGVNEIGRVLVMEWHAIGDTDGRWANSLSTFKSQLQELHAKGYRPVSVDEFVTGRFPIPAGTTPVLLTFDDSYKEHVFFGPDGETPARNSVVGILEDMERQDPTWRARAVFAFYWPAPFRESDRDLIGKKFRYLVENGFDLSNHTYNHDNLSRLTDTEVVDNLARMEAEFHEIIPEEDYRIRTITLTQGIWPKKPELAMTGEADGFRYEHDIALQVGFMPTKSPHHLDYDPRDVNRVQAYVPEFRKWVDWMEAEPNRRYVSDGDPETVTYPSSFADVADPKGELATRVYDAPED